MQNTPAVQHGVIDLILQSGWVVQLVLLSLIALSILCWTIVFAKHKTMKLSLRENAGFLDAFWKGKSLDEIFDKSEEYPRSPVAIVFKSGYKELKKLSSASREGQSTAEIVDNINRALSRATQAEISSLEKHVNWLATTASAGPFIGLFGTVWGIMNSFQNIGATGSANLAVVAPGIAEALIATATGLAAAIPAAVFYNHFVGQVKKVAVDIDCFTQDFLNLVQRSLIGGRKKT